MKKFSPVTPLSDFWMELGMSKANGKKIPASDPDFPHDELVQVGANRLGITERGKQRYQRILMERATQPRPIPKGLSDPKAAAAKSVAARRAKIPTAESEAA